MEVWEEDTNDSIDMEQYFEEVLTDGFREVQCPKCNHKAYHFSRRYDSQIECAECNTKIELKSELIYLEKKEVLTTICKTCGKVNISLAFHGDTIQYCGYCQEDISFESKPDKVFINNAVEKFTLTKEDNK